MSKSKNTQKYSILKHTYFSRANLTIFICIFAVIGGYFLLASHAVSGTANIFVSPSGNDTTCTRSASPVSFGNAAGHICATLSQACTISTGGDTVIVENGTYSGTTLDSCTGKSSTVTFTTEPGQACTYSAATPFASLPAVNTDTSSSITSFIPARTMSAARLTVPHQPVTPIR